MGHDLHSHGDPHHSLVTMQSDTHLRLSNASYLDGVQQGLQLATLVKPELEEQHQTDGVKRHLL